MLNFTVLNDTIQTLKSTNSLQYLLYMKDKYHIFHVTCTKSNTFLKSTAKIRPQKSPLHLRVKDTILDVVFILSKGTVTLCEVLSELVQVILWEEVERASFTADQVSFFSYILSMPFLRHLPFVINEDLSPVSPLHLLSQGGTNKSLDPAADLSSMANEDMIRSKPGDDAEPGRSNASPSLSDVDSLNGTFDESMQVPLPLGGESEELPVNEDVVMGNPQPDDAESDDDLDMQSSFAQSLANCLNGTFASAAEGDIVDPAVAQSHSCPPIDPSEPGANDSVDPEILTLAPGLDGKNLSPLGKAAFQPESQATDDSISEDDDTALEVPEGGSLKCLKTCLLVKNE
ncbi:hypothetical protein CPB84DRAFT_1754797 [Gymnopilus junonius]|uniref:Uncharacterized protein n=1 Tax=Gymnopilus junonius TaxID=109634 RepID=A0A9P5N9E7_GYMJU|nr:hypothetical protein CPB84DRAFT_1754797 [Gymnopilus junonius]